MREIIDFTTRRTYKVFVFLIHSTVRPVTPHLMAACFGLFYLKTCLCVHSRTRRKMQNVSNLSIFTMLVMYMLSALFGYLTFYGK